MSRFSRQTDCMDEPCRGRTKTHLTQRLDGSCKRTTTTVEHGTPLGLVAKRRHDLFIDMNGNLCTSRCHQAQASRRLYLVMDGSEMRFTCSIGHATLLADPGQLLQRVIEMVQINCEHCARVEIGNEHQALKVTLPQRTPHQIASLKAKMQADRTGRPVPISVRRRGDPTFSQRRPRME